jgi:hypothetical protein
MDERQFTTGSEGSEPRPPITERVKSLCKICGGREVNPDENACWCCKNPIHVINEQLIKLKTIGLSLVAIAYLGEERNLEIIANVADAWEEVEALGTMVLSKKARSGKPWKTTQKLHIGKTRVSKQITFNELKVSGDRGG